ncbi:MAG: WG repeat-containing protein, partial [bacterium]
MKKIGCLLCCLTLFVVLSFAHAEKKAESGLLYPIKKDGKWGYIDRTGKIVIQPQFLERSRFQEGLAC